MKNSDEMAKAVLQRLEQDGKKRKARYLWGFRVISAAFFLTVLVGAFALRQQLDRNLPGVAFEVPAADTTGSTEAAATEQTAPVQTSAPAAEEAVTPETAEPTVSTGALMTAPERQYRFYTLQLVLENGKVIRHLVLTGEGQSVLEDMDLTGLTVEEAFPLLLQPLVEAGYIAGDSESAPALMLAAYDANGYDKNGRLYEVVERDGLGAVISTALANWSITQRILGRDQTDTEYMQMLSQTYGTDTEHLQPVLEQTRQARELALTEEPGRIVVELFSMDIEKALITPKYQIGDYDQYGELILYGPGIEDTTPGKSREDIPPELWATYVEIYTPEDLAMQMRPRFWTTMTNVVGMDEDEAGALLRSRDIVPRVCYENNEEYRAKGFTDGQVFMQDTTPGMRFPSDSHVVLWVMAQTEPERNGLSQGWHPYGYDPTQSQDCIGAPAENSDQVMKAWTGEFSEEALKDAIRTYREGFAPFASGNGEKLSQVSFETDFIIASGGVARLAFVDENDPAVELKSYVDLFVDMIWNGNCATVITDWWYLDDSWTKERPLWGYLIWLKDESGTIHYYYFRTDYT